MTETSGERIRGKVNGVKEYISFDGVLFQCELCHFRNLQGRYTLEINCQESYWGEGIVGDTTRVIVMDE